MWVAGIHGQEKQGVFSIVLNGGYEDDIDRGYTFLYTGSGKYKLLWFIKSCRYLNKDIELILLLLPGGRELTRGNRRTAPQSCDQKLEKNNLALTLNYLNGNPIRVCTSANVFHK